MIEALGKFTISRHYDFLLDLIEVGLNCQGFETVSATEPITDMIDISVIPQQEQENTSDKGCGCCDKCHKENDAEDKTSIESFRDSCAIIRGDDGVFQYISRTLKKDPENVTNNDIARTFGVIVKSLFNEYHKLADEYKTTSSLVNKIVPFINYVLSKDELKSIYVDKILPEDEELNSVYQESGKIEFSHMLTNIQRIFELFFKDNGDDLEELVDDDAREVLDDNEEDL